MEYISIKTKEKKEDRNMCLLGIFWNTGILTGYALKPLRTHGKLEGKSYLL